MGTKVCFKCGIEKPLVKFYKHSKMADGHLGKCKECTKIDTKERYETLVEDPTFVNYERARGRDKYHRLYTGTGKANHKANNNWRQKFPEKAAVYVKSQRMGKPFNDAEKHHWSYNAEHATDIIWLTKQQHGKAHRFIVYNQDDKMYRTFDTNELLDSKLKHERFIYYCLLMKAD